MLLHRRSLLRIAACATVALAIISGSMLRPPASASATSDVRSAIDRVIANFDRGDVNGLAHDCDSPSSVIDEFAPHVWIGATACADWAKAFTAEAKASGITEPSVVLGSPWHVSVTGDRAYVVAPSSYVYLLAGKPAKETGSYFTFAMKKTMRGWLIEAWTWSAVKP